MIDRIHVEKAADAGVGKISLLEDDPLRYMLRAVGAGMGLTLVVFVFVFLGVNAKLTRHLPGCGYRIGFFRCRLDDYRLHEYRAVYQQQYVPDHIFRRRPNKLETGYAALDFLLLRKSRWRDPRRSSAFRRRIPYSTATRACTI